MQAKFITLVGTDCDATDGTIFQTYVITDEDNQRHLFFIHTDYGEAEPEGTNLDLVFDVGGEQISARDIIGWATSMGHGPVQDGQTLSVTKPEV